MARNRKQQKQVRHCWEVAAQHDTRLLLGSVHGAVPPACPAECSNPFDMQGHQADFGCPAVQKPVPSWHSKALTRVLSVEVSSLETV